MRAQVSTYAVIGILRPVEDNGCAFLFRLGRGSGVRLSGVGGEGAGIGARGCFAVGREHIGERLIAVSDSVGSADAR